MVRSGPVRATRRVASAPPVPVQPTPATSTCRPRQHSSGVPYRSLSTRARGPPARALSRPLGGWLRYGYLLVAERFQITSNPLPSVGRTRGGLLTRTRGGRGYLSAPSGSRSAERTEEGSAAAAQRWWNGTTARDMRAGALALVRVTADATPYAHVRTGRSPGVEAKADR